MKSGANSPHGSVYEFFRNRVFDSNDFFSNRAGIDSRSKQVRELMSVGPYTSIPEFTLSRDERQLFQALLTVETDVWLMKLE